MKIPVQWKLIGTRPNESVYQQVLCYLYSFITWLECVGMALCSSGWLTNLSDVSASNLIWSLEKFATKTVEILYKAFDENSLGGTPVFESHNVQNIIFSCLYSSKKIDNLFYISASKNNLKTDFELLFLFFIFF